MGASPTASGRKQQPLGAQHNLLGGEFRGDVGEAGHGDFGFWIADFGLDSSLRDRWNPKSKI
jgi:hypothetical protein